MGNFEYHVVPVADWPAHLERFVSQPRKSFSIHIAWGEHEKIKGVRDFHSKPRLKIEKIFNLAQSLGLAIDITFGFNSDLNSFPEWVWALSGKSQIPFFQDSKPSRWRLHQIPALKSVELREGFLAFFEEALSVIKLHSEPGGSVRSVTFDWGVFKWESPELDSRLISNRLMNRYKTPERLNLIFQTHFRDFESAATPMGFKTLFKKRPWLSCWDYKALRDEVLLQWEHPIQQKISEIGFKAPMSLPQSSEVSNSYATVVDDTFLNFPSSAHRVYPLLFQGELDPFLVRGFQLAEALQDKAKDNNEKIEPLSSWQPCASLKACSLFCQGFLPRKTFNQLQEFLARGGRTFFPLGLPKWDESMESLAWRPESFKGNSQPILVGKTPQLELNNLSNLFLTAKGVFSDPF